ncbi:biliverdin-producing heme oxygenase [Caulobacter segnis]|uniref:biliverdin-producing heme oxygenase n=1 Tax=Caulobacter segnis TaxID=88688 RepID=UPI002410A80A|nr:biliverdin-producing heme oxygenase [Caulobacter segnis]MDG2523264.1 biliverdin-producing heme oxygenase [Caulobacter segnis]
MNARARLRDATRPQHDVVDEVYSRFDLSDADDYGRFLTAQSACFTAVETALADRAQALLGDWTARTRAHLLAADLAALGLTPPAPIPAPAFADDAAVLGAVYVLEGSRFGGGVLAKRLPPGAPSNFLKAGGEPNAWRSFITSLDLHLAEDAALTSAISAAKAVFQCFETTGRHELERWHVGLV